VEVCNASLVLNYILLITIIKFQWKLQPLIEFMYEKIETDLQLGRSLITFAFLMGGGLRLSDSQGGWQLK